MKIRSAILSMSLLLLPACAPDVPREEDTDMPPMASAQIAWKTVETSAESETPQVDLLLVFSGSIEQEVNVGTFPGTMMEQPLVREWWAGSEQAIYLERGDATHLVIRSESFADEGAETVLTTITVPESDVVECVDTGGCA